MTRLNLLVLANNVDEVVAACVLVSGFPLAVVQKSLQGQDHPKT
jgi:hypothetical protein